MLPAKAILDDLFLPNFCGMRVVVSLAVMAQLLAIILALGQQDVSRWGNLSLFSLFILWDALASALLLCLSRPLLRKAGNTAAAGLSYLLLLTVTALLSEVVYQITPDKLTAFMSHISHAQFLLRNLAISAIVSALALRYFYVQHQWKKNLESESNARIQALQARIRPHFLFNCMNTIASLTRSQPREAESAIQDLADLFRSSLSDARERVQLSEELELCRKYLHIEKLRLGERLTVVWDVAGVPEQALIPSLTLQPLVENAVYHGIQPLPEGGIVNIIGRLENQLIHLTIINPVPQDAPRERPQSNKIAVDNVRQRLQAYYGKLGRLVVENGGAHNDWHYIVHLYFPHSGSTK